MDRLAALACVLAFVSVCHTATINTASVTAENGEIAIGRIKGGTFGDGSFSIGGARPPNIADFFENEDNDGGKRDNTQQNLAKPLNAHIYSGHEGQRGKGGKVGEGGSGRGQITIGTVVLPNHKNNKVNKNKNNNRKSIANDSSALETIYASNSGESIQIDAITGGHFGAGAWSIGNKRIPADKHIKNQGARPEGTHGSTVNENTRYSNTENEALHKISHGAKNNGSDNPGDGNNYGRKKSSYTSETYEEPPWIWS